MDLRCISSYFLLKTSRSCLNLSSAFFRLESFSWRYWQKLMRWICISRSLFLISYYLALKFSSCLNEERFTSWILIFGLRMPHVLRTFFCVLLKVWLLGRRFRTGRVLRSSGFDLCFVAQPSSNYVKLIIQNKIDRGKVYLLLIKRCYLRDCMKVYRRTVLKRNTNIWT